MVRKLKQRKNPDDLMNVAIHPELHRLISHQAIDSDRTIREQLHHILCGALDREDLLIGEPERIAV